MGINLFSPLQIAQRLAAKNNIVLNADNFVVSPDHSRALFVDKNTDFSRLVLSSMTVGESRGITDLKLDLPKLNPMDFEPDVRKYVPYWHPEFKQPRWLSDSKHWVREVWNGFHMYIFQQGLDNREETKAIHVYEAGAKDESKNIKIAEILGGIPNGRIIGVEGSPLPGCIIIMHPPPILNIVSFDLNPKAFNVKHMKFDLNTLSKGNIPNDGSEHIWAYCCNPKCDSLAIVLKSEVIPSWWSTVISRVLRSSKSYISDDIRVVVVKLDTAVMTNVARFRVSTRKDYNQIDNLQWDAAQPGITFKVNDVEKEFHVD